MSVNDDYYSVVLPDGRTFTCSRLVLYKTGGKCPVYGDVVDEDIATKSNLRKSRGVANG